MVRVGEGLSEGAAYAQLQDEEEAHLIPPPPCCRWVSDEAEEDACRLSGVGGQCGVDRDALPAETVPPSNTVAAAAAAA